MTTRVGRSLFELRLPGEAIIAASSHTTWNATLAMARELGLKIQKADPVDQIIIASGEYQPKKFNLTAAQLNLPKGSVSGAISLYIMVAPDLEPARVAVGAVMDILSLNRQLQIYRRYANDEIVHELLSRIAARLQVKMEALSANPAQRAEQARALMPPGLADRCAVVPAILLTAEQDERSDTQTEDRQPGGCQVSPGASSEAAAGNGVVRGGTHGARHGHQPRTDDSRR